jgi:putative Holliday junction resolvase
MALSDAMEVIATPLDHLERKSDNLAVKAIVQAIYDLNVELLLIGIPLDQDGHVSRQGEKIKSFQSQLKERVKIPIQYWDEGFSTQDAEALLYASGKFRIKQKGIIDSAAAAVILQSYMNRVK